ncbi:sulfurtransferase DndC [Cylindrospermopsis raciborskii S07]|uniref:Sulfurtransferase DndC n=2 Tax=Cylindrospermopsis raciborskii TaxID=77022 RepID=A0A853MHD7_9CYAN|nr:DNA phosphorothioation system sulfurtransferase DndC [Cylindrospermopsis raciborskii]OBU77942.1 sulfurtransferase DndC [Cylindrospermopsis raciborskii CS-505]OHY39876.1 sulfurtransferase DndC [Cylindrospermopsis raciborskii CS-508]PNJ97028.1 sulfurtransferase DndC [Cylindrospermopsis raciborskii C04]PNJ97921.1 sulfurtransferase DndC [Cylindrospermopsis raciborskii C03]PNK01120.1 sulfurtransferase DndC [Cylindrospermopsis raciborskii C07]
MVTSESKTPPNRTVAELVEYIQVLTKEIQQLYCLDHIPWVVGYSGGKDSTAILQLIWNAISDLPPEKRTKTIHVITTDTGVENPYVSDWVRASHENIKKAAQEQQVPMQAHLLQPETKETYWVGLIGKGYPAPRQKFRWCTERLKISPSNRFIRDMVRESGETILVLGIRKTESKNRAATMKKMEAKRLRDRLSPNGNLPNSLVYSPIEDWRTDEVWLYLMQWNNPWGHSNKDLFVMYRQSTEDNECPLVVDTSTPSCGSSRFGCWVCTLVDRDVSLSAMIQNDQEKEWMQPIVEFRKELDIENDREKRDFRRIWGEVQLFERNRNGEMSVEPIPGPYTKYWREYWLRKLLTAQKEMRENAPENMANITLISMEELSEIRRIWLEEKHEFDDSLPQIYEQVTGEKFKDSRPGADYSLLGGDEWEVLEQICAGNSMELELMAKLLDTERQFKKKTRRVGIFETLEKCFQTSSRSQQEAIDYAHFKRDLRLAASEGNVATIRQAFKQLDIPRVQEQNNTEYNTENKTEDKKPLEQPLSFASMKYRKYEYKQEE